MGATNNENAQKPANFAVAKKIELHTHVTLAQTMIHIVKQTKND